MEIEVISFSKYKSQIDTKREIPITKSQITNNIQSPNSNHQKIFRSLEFWSLRFWSLFGYWCLPCTIVGAGLGYWIINKF